MQNFDSFGAVDFELHLKKTKAIKRSDLIFKMSLTLENQKFGCV